MPKLLGDKPLTNAEKCMRYRAKKHEAWLATLSKEHRAYFKMTGGLPLKDADVKAKWEADLKDMMERS